MKDIAVSKLIILNANKITDPIRNNQISPIGCSIVKINFKYFFMLYNK